MHLPLANALATKSFGREIDVFTDSLTSAVEYRKQQWEV